MENYENMIKKSNTIIKLNIVLYVLYGVSIIVSIVSAVTGLWGFYLLGRLTWLGTVGVLIPIVIFGIQLGIKAIQEFKHDVSAAILTFIGAAGVPVVGILGANKIIKYSQEKLDELKAQEAPAAEEAPVAEPEEEPVAEPEVKE